jgi:hypothetical protein
MDNTMLYLLCCIVYWITFKAYLEEKVNQLNDRTDLQKIIIEIATFFLMPLAYAYTFISMAIVNLVKR